MHCNLPFLKSTTKNRIIFDWLTFTSKIHSPEDFISLLGLDKPDIHFSPCPGINGYRDGLDFGGIKICWNNWAIDSNDVNTVCVSMSGQGCRTFEKYGNGNFVGIFDLILTEFCENSDDRNMNITRLDVAYDDFEGLIDYDSILSDTFCNNWVSRFHRANANVDIPNNSSRCNDKSDPGKCLYWGSKTSDLRIRIYDKKAEQHSDLPIWFRCELQLRRSDALGFIRNYINQSAPVSLYPDDSDPALRYMRDSSIDDTVSVNDIGRLFFGIINNYLRFVVPNPNDSNRRRWDLAPHWRRFLQSLELISIYSKGKQSYDLSNLEEYTLNTAANAIYTMIHIIGVHSFVDYIVAHFNSSKVNPKYLDIINRYAEHSASGSLYLKYGGTY